MARSCTVCKHPERDAIDRALVDGASLRDIAGQYGLTKSSVARHQAEHLPASLVKAAEAEDVAHAIDIVKQLKAINGAALEVLKNARASGDGDLVLKAVDRVQKQIELQAKLIGELDERPQINIWLAPEWMDARAALVQALSPYPEARIAAADALHRLEAGK